MKTEFEYQVHLTSRKAFNLDKLEYPDFNKLLPKSVAAIVEMIRIGIVPRVGERFFVIIDEIELIPEEVDTKLEKIGINLGDQLVITEIEFSLSENHVSYNIYVDQAPEE